MSASSSQQEMLSFVTLQIEIGVCTMQDRAYIRWLPLDLRHFFYFFVLFIYLFVRICLQCRRPRFFPWVGKIPWRRKWQSTPVFLPGKSHRQRSLVGYTPWSHKESDMTERLTLSLLPFPLEATFLCLRCYEFSHTLGRCGSEVQKIWEKVTLQG